MKEKINIDSRFDQYLDFVMDNYDMNRSDMINVILGLYLEEYLKNNKEAAINFVTNVRIDHMKGVKSIPNEFSSLSDRIKDDSRTVLDETPVKNDGPKKSKSKKRDTEAYRTPKFRAEKSNGMKEYWAKRKLARMDTIKEAISEIEHE